MLAHDLGHLIRVANFRLLCFRQSQYDLERDMQYNTKFKSNQIRYQFCIKYFPSVNMYVAKMNIASKGFCKLGKNRVCQELQHHAQSIHLRLGWVIYNWFERNPMD